jgi:hypothetical protein
MKYRKEILRNCCFTLLAITVFSCAEHDEAKIKNTITNHIISAIDDGYCVGTAVAFYDNGHEQHFSYGYDRIFKDDILDTTYVWSRIPGTDSDAKKMTVLVNYQGGIKRFYKIYRELGKATPIFRRLEDLLTR